MRGSSGLIRWKRTESIAKKMRTPVQQREESKPDGTRSRSSSTGRAARFASSERESYEMSRTQARRLAFTVVRNERGYLAHEVRRTEHIYDLAVIDTATQQSYIVRTVKELTELMTELHDPQLTTDAQSGMVFIKAPFYEEVRGMDEAYANIVPYTLIARYHPGDGTDDVDVTIEPEPGPGSDLSHMFLRVDNCLGAACGDALAEGEHERSRLLAEVSKRLRRYQQQYVS